ncbi:F-box protein CPR1-like [Rutidosis leptorrhynchoides]|uniref:F-box protein CPR1-like n=1 Tax=Rutidosis leptorrhynchoides TaxID=125765 RepID=UPI003A99CB50
MSDTYNPISPLNHLPPELIEAILPFLPPKSLGRFKSVSKRWYSLISSPSFIKSHIHNNPNPNPTQLILLPNDNKSIYSVDIKQFNTLTTSATVTAKRLNVRKPLLMILGSCNGLVLSCDMYDNTLCLLNLNMGHTFKLPYISEKEYDTYEFGYDSDTDDYEKEYDTYGLGYDSSTDDYKVVVISHMSVPDSDPDSKFLFVYSLRNNSWKRLPDFSYQQHDVYSLCPGVLLNNNLHWVVKSRRSTMTIAAFDLANEQFREIKLPNSFKCSQVFVVGGKLVAVMRNGLLSPNLIFELWVMEEYGVPKSWKKLYIFEETMDLSFEFFVQVSNRDILLGNNKANEFVIYNMDEGRCTSVPIEGCPKGFKSYATCVEGLESLERFR